MKCSLVAILISIAFCGYVLGCSRSGGMISQFDPSEYVFIGKVTGYVTGIGKGKKNDENEYLRLRTRAAGIVVEVTDNVSTLSSPNATTFEVFDFDLLGDCSYAGMEVSQLNKEFPVGSMVRVIARDSYLLSKSGKHGRPRLETLVPHGGFWINNDATGNPETTSKSIFDYRNTVPNHWLQTSFELRKDLKRLGEAKTQEDRRVILDRVIFSDNTRLVYFDHMLKMFTASDSEYKEYLEKRQQYLASRISK